MKPDPSSPRDDDDALVDLHREAGERLDERPDPSVRARVLEAARQAEELQRARARSASRKPSRAWPRSAAALMLVAVLTGLVLTQSFDGSHDLVTDGPRRDGAADRLALDNRSTTPAAAAPSAPTPAAQAEHRFARRPFTRDRSAAPSRTNDTRERESHPEEAPAAAPNEPVAAAPAPEATNSAVASDSAARIVASPQPFVAPSREAWVAEIVRLRRSGDDAGADAELVRLRQRYPDFVVPTEALPAR